MSQQPTQSPASLIAQARAARQNNHLIQARDAFYQAFKLAPTGPDAYDALMGVGDACMQLRDFDAALQVFTMAQKLKPNEVAANFNLAAVLEMQGDPAAAIQFYERAQQIRPRPHTRLLAATRQPVMFDSTEEIRAWRTRLEENLAQLQKENLRVDIERIPSGLLNVTYQGLDDRDVQAAFASLIAPPPPIPLEAKPGASAPGPKRDHGDRIRVGFISTFFRSHTIGRITQGLIAKLARDDFHVTVFTFDRFDATDTVAAAIERDADSYVLLPRTLPEAREQIRAQALDVLIYMDIGMEQLTYNLAFSRLARVQCVTWGHPSTTGIPAIDHFISTELFESHEAPSQYTEHLVQLPTVPTYYYRPKLTAPDSLSARRACGWDENVHLYGCLQSLFKLHPEFDAILDGILQQDPKGVILIPVGGAKFWDNKLKHRMSRTMSKTFDRVRFFEPLPYEQYLNLTAACDAMLAPIHFGAGNTSYEAFAAGMPTITMPSNLMKGRITHGLYRAMNVMDCVADTPQQYIDLAVRVATERDFAAHVREKILAANHVLYENIDAVRDLENFLKGVTT